MSVVSWLCPSCSAQNAYWRNYCEECEHPQRGYDPRTKPESPAESDSDRAWREAFEHVERMLQRPPLVPNAPLTPPVLLQPDCGCPANGVCMSVSCPRALRITCSGGPS